MSRLTLQMAELRGLLASTEVEDAGVSGWSVGMHVQHCALAMAGIARELLGCDAPPPGKPTAVGWLVLKTGKIPRGGAQAPHDTIPDPDVATKVLEGMLTVSETLLDQVPEARESAWFQHFALGVLDRDRALRFVEIHNDHHLAIIDDILSG